MTGMAVKENKEDEEEERRGEDLKASSEQVVEEVVESECKGHPEPDTPAKPLNDSFVECPLCGEAFPSYVVEVHASTCGDSGADRTGRRVHLDSGCIVID